MTIRYIIFIFVTLMVSCVGAAEHDITLKSPDGRIVVSVISKSGSILYRIEAEGETVIVPV